MKLATLIQIQNQVICISHYINTIGKGMHLFFFVFFFCFVFFPLLSYEQIVEQTGFSNFGRTTSLEGKFWIQMNSTPFKNWPCVVSCLLWKEYIMMNTFSSRGGPRGVMVKAVDCRIVVCEFVPQSRYYVHFRANTLRKGMNSLILPAMG